MKITLEQLRKDNTGYAYGASSLDERDLKIVNDLIEKIESTRTVTPQSLDKIIYTDKYGYYHRNALLEENTYHDGKPCIVGSASAHIYLNDAGEIRFSTSGGSYDGGKDIRKFEYAGKAERNFWTWSSYGAGAHQGIDFNAEVSMFRYNERPRKLRHLTQEFLTMIYVSDKGIDTSSYDYRFTVSTGYQTAFRTEPEYLKFLAGYKAIEEPSKNQYNRKFWILNPVQKFYYNKSEFDAAPGQEYVEWWNGSDRRHKLDIIGNDHITRIDRSEEPIYGGRQ